MSTPGIEGRLFGAAMLMLPGEFRSEYGEEIRVLARDTVREAQSQGAGSARSARRRIVVDLLLAAMREHARKESVMHFNLAGLGAGIATAIGLPMVIASYSSYGFWGLVRQTGAVVGFDSSDVVVHPTIVLVGAVLTAIGLLALVHRLATASPAASSTLRIAAVVGSAMVGLGGAAMFAYALPTVSEWRGAFDLVGGLLLGPGFLVILAVLIAAGVIALRTRALGVLSFAPLAVAGSLVLLMVVALLGFATGMPMEAFVRGPAMVVSVWLVPATSVLLGAALALTPIPSGARVRRSEPRPA
ncbi:hypothetical protein [Agromyces bracchium]|uniref:Uncharacterized protein n=1 Tax=Agromyces bracchium TaxID=88376 RepID=A0A6I3M1S8_9MICO|nr:hypothetical protein [Agromyces bracchium]MTH66848.1 hypothetical protein [Agromyces bracchium]